MNRWDEIQGAALDAAVTAGIPEARRAQFAADLIQLVGQMMNGLGKVVAGAGERRMNYANCTDPECDCDANGCRSEQQQAHTVYLVGEDMQRAANEVTEQAQETDLERWDDLPGKGWAPRCRECGMRRTHKLDCRTGRRPHVDPWGDAQQATRTGGVAGCCGSAIGHFPTCPQPVVDRQRLKEADHPAEPLPVRKQWPLGQVAEADICRVTRSSSFEGGAIPRHIARWRDNVLLGRESCQVCQRPRPLGLSSPLLIQVEASDVYHWAEVDGTQTAHEAVWVTSTDENGKPYLIDGKSYLRCELCNLVKL